MKILFNILLAVLILSIFSCKKEEILERSNNKTNSITLKDGDTDIVEAEDEAEGIIIVETEDEDEDEDEGIVETEDEDEDEDEGIINTDSSEDDDGTIIRNPFGGKKPPTGGR